MTEKYKIKETVLEKVRASDNKEKGSFQKKEMFLRNLKCNIDSKQSKINEVVVKMLFVLESGKQ